MKIIVQGGILRKCNPGRRLENLSKNQGLLRNDSVQHLSTHPLSTAKPPSRKLNLSEGKQLNSRAQRAFQDAKDKKKKTFPKKGGEAAGVTINTRLGGSMNVTFIRGDIPNGRPPAAPEKGWISENRGQSNLAKTGVSLLIGHREEYEHHDDVFHARCRTAR